MLLDWLSGSMIFGLLSAGGACCVIIAVYLSRQHAIYSARLDKQVESKFLEDIRNFSFQIGLLTIGIAVTLFTYTYQQKYQKRQDDLTKRYQLTKRVKFKLNDAIQEYQLNVKPIADILDNGGPFVLSGDIDHWNDTIKGLLLDGNKRVDVYSKLLADASLDVDFKNISQSMLVRDIFRDDDQSDVYIDMETLMEMSSDDKIIRFRFSEFNGAYDGLQEELSKPGIDWMRRVKSDRLYGVRGHEMLQNFDLGRRASIRQIARLCVIQSLLARQVNSSSKDDHLESTEDSAIEWTCKHKATLENHTYGRASCHELLTKLLTPDTADEEIVFVHTPAKAGSMLNGRRLNTKNDRHQ